MMQPDHPDHFCNHVMTSNSIEQSEQPPTKVVTTSRGYTRTLHARLVCFRCEWCSQEREVWQYPGAAPRYCEECRAQAQQSMNSARQREKRERERERNANRYATRRAVGRPRTRR